MISPQCGALSANILRQLGFNNVVEADDGTTAWDTINREKIDFIVSD